MNAIKGIPRIIFVGFFASHILATLCIDVQAIAPTALVPQALANLLQWYAACLNDPLMSHPQELPWFQSLVCMEMIFQLPFFFWAVSELSNVNRKGTFVYIHKLAKRSIKDYLHSSFIRLFDSLRFSSQ